MLTQVNQLAAHLYLLQAEPMPEPILDDEGEIDVEADNAAIEEWSQGSDSLSYDTVRLERFIVRTEELLEELQVLELDETQDASPQYMTLVYDAAKDVFDHDKKMIRTYFMWLYLVLFHRPDGPRWGEFIAVYGADNFAELVRERFGDLVG